MTRLTIDYGIDLGTTNSSIAFLRNGRPEVIKNNDSSEQTASAVWIDRADSLVVGARAKDRLEDDPENAKCEFKLQMGRDSLFEFVRSGRKMKPEDLSAEVLKSLKADVYKRQGEQLDAVVITVPAALETPACDATRQAAELAGFRQSPLLQEPVAAALSYTLRERETGYWLVYDFGGGTFDTAIIDVQKESVYVDSHGGDNLLGGKHLDWAIVDELLIPAVKKEFPLSNFYRGNRKWIKAIAKLKYHAEKAKIELSHSDKATIVIDPLCQDDRGNLVEFTFILTQADVARLATPFIVRTLNICKKVLNEKGFQPGDIKKMILVGGPTLMPCVRDMLSDPRNGLGIPLEFSMDPMTVVASGAAIFAGTQRIEEDPDVVRRPVPKGKYRLELEYKPVGFDTKPMVGGEVHAAEGEDLSGYTIEFINESLQPEWKTGKISIGANNKFVATLYATDEQQNVFRIELCNAAGTRLETEPASITYTVHIDIVEPPLPHSIGVALANNEMETFIEKGTPLPVRKRHKLRTAYEVTKGQDGRMFRIPIMEGESPRADRNSTIGVIEVTAHQVKRDVPVGSEVHITIEIDQSRQVRVKAYVPHLDEEYEEVATLKKALDDLDTIRANFEKEKERLGKIREEANRTRDSRALEIISQIERERIIEDAETNLNAGRIDPEALDRANNCLLQLRMFLDDAESALEWPNLVDEAEDLIKQSKSLTSEYGKSEDQRGVDNLEREIRSAMSTRDPELLVQAVQALRDYTLEFLDRAGILQVLYFRDLCNEKHNMTDPRLADQLISQGHRAINNNDYEGLRSVNKQLVGLLPTPPPLPDPTGSILTR